MKLKSLNLNFELESYLNDPDPKVRRMCVKLMKIKRKMISNYDKRVISRIFDDTNSLAQFLNVIAIIDLERLRDCLTVEQIRALEVKYRALLQEDIIERHPICYLAAYRGY